MGGKDWAVERPQPEPQIALMMMTRQGWAGRRPQPSRWRKIGRVGKGRTAERSRPKPSVRCGCRLAVPLAASSLLDRTADRESAAPRGLEGAARRRWWAPPTG